MQEHSTPRGVNIVNIVTLAHLTFCTVIALRTKLNLSVRSTMAPAHPEKKIAARVEKRPTSEGGMSESGKMSMTAVSARTVESSLTEDKARKVVKTRNEGAEMLSVMLEFVTHLDRCCSRRHATGFKGSLSFVDVSSAGYSDTGNSGTSCSKEPPTPSSPSSCEAIVKSS